MKLIQQLQLDSLTENKKKVVKDHDKWIDAVKAAYPEVADKLKFKGKVEAGKHLFYAEVPGEDRCYGVYDVDADEGEVLGESRESIRIIKVSEARMKETANDLIERAAKLVAKKGGKDYYAKVAKFMIDLDRRKLFKGDLKAAEEAARGYLD